MNTLSTINLDDNEILGVIEHDLSESRSYHDEAMGEITTWIDEYNGEPYGNEVDGRSQIVWKLIKKQGEALVSNIIKPFMSNYDIVEVNPVTEADVYKSKISEKLINHYWNKDMNATRLLKMLGKVVVPEGTVFMRVGWNRKTKEKKQTIPLEALTEEMRASFGQRGAKFKENIKDSTVTITVVSILENNPTAKVVRNEDVFIDPTADTFEESKFLIYESRVSLSDVKKDPVYDKDAVKKLEKIIDENDDARTDGNDIHNYNTTDFEFSDKARKKVTLYEYWGEYDIDGDGNTCPVVATMAKYGEKNLILRMERNPFPHKKIPFVCIPLYEDPFKIYGRSLSDAITDEQKLSTSVVRGIIDNMANSNNGIKFFKKGALDATNFARLKRGDKYVEINTHDSINTAILDGNFNQLPQHIYQMLGMLDTQAQSLTGLSNAMQGIPGSEIKSSTSNFSAMMSQSQIRLLDVTNNMTYGIKSMLNMWMAMSAKYVDENEIKRITGIDIPTLKGQETQRLIQEFGLDQLPPDTAQKAMMLVAQEVEDMFNREDLKYDIKMKVGTDGLKQIKIQNLLMLMQQLAPLAQAGNVPPDAIKLLVADLAEQLDRPDIAQMISSYQPQPDPMAQEFQKAELEGKKASNAKDMALAENAMARSRSVDGQTKKGAAMLDGEVANKYADVSTKMSDIEGDQRKDTIKAHEAGTKRQQANQPKSTS